MVYESGYRVMFSRSSVKDKLLDLTYLFLLFKKASVDCIIDLQLRNYKIIAVIHNNAMRCHKRYCGAEMCFSGGPFLTVSLKLEGRLRALSFKIKGSVSRSIMVPK